jgi:hypothetical protein
MPEPEPAPEPAAPKPPPEPKRPDPGQSEYRGSRPHGERFTARRPERKD